MIGPTEAASSQPGHSTTLSNCTVCSSRVAIYTCPRCATRTCSQPCSVAHKTNTGCSGVRDMAKLVPMNRYTHGTMMDDYVFLEDVSRKVSEWGQDIARGGYATGMRMQGRRGGRGGMGRGNRTRDGASSKKRDMLRSQLELRDVEVDLLPAGMRRRTLNHSTWDPKYVKPIARSTHAMTPFFPLPQEEDSLSNDRVYYSPSRRRGCQYKRCTKTIHFPHPPQQF